MRDQAQSLGWAKATKLEGRSTQQGLVGLYINKNIGALVEVNCETDFVARNKHFKEFVELASRACVNHVSTMPSNDVVSKVQFHGDSLKKLVLEDGKTLVDQLALLIGNVGENATIRRATCFKVSDSIQLTGVTHPNDSVSSDGQVQVGKYGAIVAFKADDGVSSTTKNLCQQIIGMNPTRIGDKEKDQPSNDKDSEPCLIFQEYLLDPTVRVDALLEESKVEIVDFHRIECGGDLAEQSENTVAEAAN